MRNNQPNSNNRNTILKLFIIVLVSIVFGFGVYFIIVLWAFPAFSVNISGVTDWNMLEGFASVLSLSLLAGGLIFAVTEYINTENTKQHEKLAEDREKAKLSYDIYKAIFDKLTDPEQEAARRWILSNITIKEDDEDIADWYEKTHKKITSGGTKGTTGLPEGQKAVKLTLNCFDYIGFVASHYWEVENDSLDWISAPVAKIWRRIGPYVLHVRALRKTRDFYLSAEYIGDICIKWRRGKGMADEEYVEKTL